jgi:3-oxoacyl-[acyl-carrier protein] reductase
MRDVKQQQGNDHVQSLREDCARHPRFARHRPRQRDRVSRVRRASSGALRPWRQRSRWCRCRDPPSRRPRRRGEADLAAADGPQKLAKVARDIVGDRLDILVANAGISKAATIEDTTIDDFDKLFAVNVRAPFFLVQQLLPILSKGSCVVLVSSLAARGVVGAIPVYAATKGAIDTLTKHFASLLGARGIRVNAIAPGVVETDMSNFTKTDAGRDFALSIQAFKRLAQPDDIGGVVAFLASDEARWITGDTIHVDGGSKL